MSVTHLLSPNNIQICGTPDLLPDVGEGVVAEKPDLLGWFARYIDNVVSNTLYIKMQLLAKDHLMAMKLFHCKLRQTFVMVLWEVTLKWSKMMYLIKYIYAV